MNSLLVKPVSYGYGAIPDCVSCISELRVHSHITPYLAGIRKSNRQYPEIARFVDRCGCHGNTEAYEERFSMKNQLFTATLSLHSFLGIVFAQSFRRESFK